MVTTDKCFIKIKTYTREKIKHYKHTDLCCFWQRSEQLTNKANKTHSRISHNEICWEFTHQITITLQWQPIIKLATKNVVHLHNKHWDVVWCQWWLWIQQWKLNTPLITQLLYSFSVILLNIQQWWFGHSNYYWHPNHEMCKETPCSQNLQIQKCPVWVINIKE